MTIQVMVDDLRRRGLGNADVDRVLEAFALLGGKIQKWPTPLMVIESLPKRVTPESHRVSHYPRQTMDMDEIIPMIRNAIREKGKKISVILPGESFADYHRAYEQSGLTRPQFDQRRLSQSAKIVDPEADAERQAIQAEGA